MQVGASKNELSPLLNENSTARASSFKLAFHQKNMEKLQLLQILELIIHVELLIQTVPHYFTNCIAVDLTACPST